MSAVKQSNYRQRDFTFEAQLIRLERWKFTPDPLEAIRSDALEAHHGRGPSRFMG